MSRKRMVLKCLHETDKIDGEHHYIPCAIHEDEAGYRPMRGKGIGAMPWYWGTSHEQCQRHCDTYNKEAGYTEKDVMEIVTSSMRASNLLGRKY